MVLNLEMHTKHSKCQSLNPDIRNSTPSTEDNHLIIITATYTELNLEMHVM